MTAYPRDKIYLGFLQIKYQIAASMNVFYLDIIYTYKSYHW